MMDLGERLSREHADLDGTYELLLVGRGDLLGGERVEVLQHAMEMARAVCGGRGAETFAESFRALREIGEAFEERAEVEAGAHGENGQAVASAKIGEGGEGAFAVVAGGGGFAWIEHVEKMMRDLPAFGRCRFGGANV